MPKNDILCDGRLPSDPSDFFPVSVDDPVPPEAFAHVGLGLDGLGNLGEAGLAMRGRGQSCLLQEMLGLPKQTPSQEVWQRFLQLRAEELGLPAETSEADLMQAECGNPASLTTAKLMCRYRDGKCTSHSEDAK